MLAIFITPTREQIKQVAELLETLKYDYREYEVMSLYGGKEGVESQEGRLLQRNVDFVVATPGRLKEHIFRSNIDLGTVQTMVID